MPDNLVEVQSLKKWFPVQTSFVETILARKIDYVRAVDGISFDIRRGEVFGLAGESGSGKTTTGRLIVRLVEPTEGQILFEGTDIATLPAREMRKLRWRMQVIFQDPTASLNPRMKIGDAVGHGLEIHGVAKGRTKREMVIGMMEKGEIPNPINPPSGCRFHPRCPYAMEICSQEEPSLRPAGEERLVACHLRT